MTWHITDGYGYQPIANTESAAKHRLGTRVRAWNDTSGEVSEGLFVYALGVDSTVVGSLVTFNATTYQTALSPTTGASGAPVAVAMSANTGGKYGWYQLSGLATIKKTAIKISPQVKLYVSGTAGRVYATASAGKLIQGMKSANLATVVSATSTVLVTMEHPHLRGVTSAI